MKPTPFNRVTGMSLLAIRQWSTCSFCILALLAVISPGSRAQSESASLKTEVQRAMRRATTYFRTNVASHGGYVYHYSIDLSRRWGEGEATTDQIWVQPPGTPTVGLAFLRAWHATGEKMYLDAARETAEALVYGQMKSGGWTNCVDFNPQGNRVARYHIISQR